MDVKVKCSCLNAGLLAEPLAEPLAHEPKSVVISCFYTIVFNSWSDGRAVQGVGLRSTLISHLEIGVGSNPTLITSFFDGFFFFFFFPFSF
jgi:hypothetical protein